MERFISLVVFLEIVFVVFQFILFMLTNAIVVFMIIFIT